MTKSSASGIGISSGPSHHAWLKRHTSFKHDATHSLCFALSLGCSLGKTTILLECQL